MGRSSDAPTLMTSLISVRAEYLNGHSVGLLMSDIRTWLNHKGIQPKEFKAITLPFGGVAFDVEFRVRPLAGAGLCQTDFGRAPFRRGAAHCPGFRVFPSNHRQLREQPGAHDADCL